MEHTRGELCSVCEYQYHPPPVPPSYGIVLASFSIFIERVLLLHQRISQLICPTMLTLDVVWFFLFYTSLIFACEKIGLSRSPSVLFHIKKWHGMSLTKEYFRQAPNGFIGNDVSLIVLHNLSRSIQRSVFFILKFL